MGATYHRMGTSKNELETQDKGKGTTSYTMETQTKGMITWKQGTEALKHIMDNINNGMATTLLVMADS